MGVQHFHRQSRPLRHVAVVCLLSVLLASCSVVGPASVRSGRLAYNEAIIETDNQQMLLMAVRTRYGERSSLLAVSSITANVSVKTSAGAQLGYGDSDSYAGNLVPFGAGVIYEENPTISYTPVGGGQYASGLMSPISISLLAQYTQNMIDPAPVYLALLSSINDIFNPDFQFMGGTTDQRFSRIVELMTKLTKAHRMHWVQDSDQSHRFSIIIEHFWPEFSGEVSELCVLLGLPEPTSESLVVIVPVSAALERPETGGIGLTTRSTYDLLEIFAAAVDVPAADLSSGIAATYPPPGLIGSKLRVHFSESRPETASVAVAYRDGWFYIDDTDQGTKLYFTLLASLLSNTIADTISHDAAPVLTVPVSR